LEDRNLLSGDPAGTAFLALTRQSFSGVVGSFTPETGFATTDYSACAPFANACLFFC
jgi:hypothetical protein